MSLRFVTPLLVALAACVAWQQVSTPDVLLVGNVTIDVVDGVKSAGGAVTYAAAVASAFGARACIVTANAPDADLSPLDKRHDVVVVESPASLVFEHSYTFWGSHRKLRVPSQPGLTLTAAHVPARCRNARLVLLGPLMPADMDPASFLQHARSSWLGWLGRLGRPQHVGLMAQGLQRGLDANKWVLALKEPSGQLLHGLGPETSVFLSDVETDVWRNGTVQALAQQTQRFLVTRGGEGADEFTPGSAEHHAPYPVEHVADTNGAGDSFATAYMLALAAGHSHPAAVANWAGAMAVSQPQSCKPACVGEAIRRGWHTMPQSQAAPLRALLHRLAHGLGLTTSLL